MKSRTIDTKSRTIDINSSTCDVKSAAFDVKSSTITVNSSAYDANSSTFYITSRSIDVTNSIRTPQGCTEQLFCTPLRRNSGILVVVLLPFGGFAARGVDNNRYRSVVRE